MLLIFLFALLSQNVFSQEKEPAEEVPADYVQLKKIVVTGSYVKQVVTEKSATPLTTVDNTKMLETGSYTVANALRENPIFSGAESFVAMHGQTSADNLVLLNGLRLPKTAGGDSVNIDFLPATAIEKVEVLKDGASALYGSEALSGVINIQTKKDFDGINTFVRLTHPEIAADQEAIVGLTYGKNWGKNNILAIFQYRQELPLFFNDTQYGVKDINAAGTLNSSPGNVIDSTNAFHRAADCPANQIDTSGRCRYDNFAGRNFAFGNYGSGQSRQYYSGFLGYSRKISKDMGFDFTNIISQRNWIATAQPRIWNFDDDTATGGANYSIPSAIANTWGTLQSGSGAPSNFTNPVSLRYSAAEELGQTVSERKVLTLTHQARSYGALGNWDWEVSGGYGYSFFRDVTVSGEANKQAIHSLMTTINPSTSQPYFNPFKTSGNKDDLSSVMIQPWFEHTSDILNPKVVFSGPLFQLNSRPVSMAIGAEGQWQKFKWANDDYSLAGLTLNGSASNQDGQRNVGSAFMELVHSPIEPLDVQLALRYDKYSDVGDTTNPKVGLAYHLSKSWTFRASYGTGFKAPDLFSVFKKTITEQLAFRDEVICAANGESDPYCNNGVYPVTSFGNRNLKPETASHYNIGWVFTPKSNLLLKMDYWSVDGADGLADVIPTTVTRQEQEGSLPAGIVVNRDSITNRIISMSHPEKINGAIFKIRGLDFKVEKRGVWKPWNLGTYNTRFEVEHSHVLYSGGNSFPTDAFRKQYDNNWRNFASFVFAKDKNFSKIMMRTYSAVDVDTGLGSGVGKGTTSIFSEFDYHHEYMLSEKSSLSMGIKNIFDRTPPRLRRGILFPADTSAYFLGRTYYIGYSHDF